MTAAKLKAWREAHVLSQQGLAQALGVSKRTLEGWEQSRYSIPTILELALCELERRLKRGKRR